MTSRETPTRFFPIAAALVLTSAPANAQSVPEPDLTAEEAALVAFNNEQQEAYMIGKDNASIRQIAHPQHILVSW